MPNLEEATDEEMESYIKEFRDQRNKLIGYESTYMDKLEKLALADKT